MYSDHEFQTHEALYTSFTELFAIRSLRRGSKIRLIRIFNPQYEARLGQVTFDYAFLGESYSGRGLPVCEEGRVLLELRSEEFSPGFEQAFASTADSSEVDSLYTK